MPDTSRAEVYRWFSTRGFTTLLDGTALARRTAGARLVAALAILLAATAIVPAVMPDRFETSGQDFWTAVFIVVSMVGFWIVRNLVRRRPPLAPLVTIGRAERIAFVALPTLAALAAPSAAGPIGSLEFTALENRLVNGLGWLLGQAIILGLVTLVVRSGLWSLGAWLRRQITSSFVAAGSALGRTLPLLLGVVGLIFLTTELWQTMGRLDGWAYWLTLGLFVWLGWGFLSSRGHLDLDSLATFETAESLSAELADTPLAAIGLPDGPLRCPLSKDQESSLRLVAAVSRLTVAAVIGLAVFAFFVVLGALAINAEVAQSWLQAPPRILLQWRTSAHAFAITLEGIKVAAFLGVFSGFYFAVVSATDPGMRAGLRDTSEDAIREACAARLAALTRYPSSLTERGE